MISLNSNPNTEQELKILDNRFLLLQKLGVGESSEVWLARELNSSQQDSNYYLNDYHYGYAYEEPKYSAIKIYRNSSSLFIENQYLRYFKRENEVLDRINHNNIIRKLASGLNSLLNFTNSVTQKEQKVNYICFVLAPNDGLFDYIYYPKKGFNEYIARYFFSQLVEGVMVLHLQGIVHRDIKIDNILLDKKWNIKIVDFGYSTEYEDDTLLTSYIGTTSYAAPEILKNVPYLGTKTDVFSLGVVLYVLVIGQMSFLKASVKDDCYKNIIKGDYDGFWNMKSKLGYFSCEFKDLINKMLTFNPKERISLDEINYHEWMLGDFPLFEDINIELTRRKKIVAMKRT